MKFSIRLFSIFIFLFALKNISAQNFDTRMLLAANSFHTPSLDNFMMTATQSNSFICTAIPASLMIYGKLSRDKDTWHNGLKMGTSILAAEGVTYVLKNIIKRPRPFDTNIQGLRNLITPTDYSMPSGHASTSFALCASICFAYPLQWKYILPSAAFTSLICYSRMYIGVHYPSDILAGILVGTAMSLATSVFYKKVYGF